MIDWAIYNKNLKLNILPDFKFQCEIGDYNLIIAANNVQGIQFPERNESLFVFGYIMPRLNTIIKDNIFENIINGIKSFGPEYISNFKGNFVLIGFYDSKIFIINDHFGVCKYFYSGEGNHFIASSHISFLKKNKPLEISRKNILLYYLFNYFIEGITVFENCYYSTPASCHVIGQEIHYEHYFSVKDFIDSHEIQYNKKESLVIAADLWRKLVKQYLDFFKNKKISQTLTAGLDSRLILAGFRANNYKPSTFTFGRIDSMDVIHAKKVSRKLKLEHEHLYPGKSFFDNYSELAIEVIQRSSGMATLFRAHRLNAYSFMKNISDVIFFGFIGSETIRGLYPDRLLVPAIIVDSWLNKDLDLKEYFPSGWFHFSDEELLEVKDEILKYEFFKRPDILLFNLMIPLHFAQDIILNDTLNLTSVAPFWDLDFLDFQKNTEFFVNNNRKKEFAKFGHFSRKKGPFFSTNLIKMLDKENSRISLGKGYSPADYVFSMYYAALKFKIHKTFFEKLNKTPNFDYKDWFKSYLKSYIKDNSLPFINSDKETLARVIANVKGTDELSFLNFVKAVNVNLILNEL